MDVQVTAFAKEFGAYPNFDLSHRLMFSSYLLIPYHEDAEGTIRPSRDEATEALTRARRAIGLDLPGDLKDHVLEPSCITSQVTNDKVKPDETREKGSNVTTGPHMIDLRPGDDRSFLSAQESNHQQA